MRSSLVVSLLLAAVTGGLSALAWPHLPDPAPIHFDAAGHPDGYGSPLVVALLVPVLQLAVPLLVLGLLKLDPRQENIRASARGIDLILVALGGFFLLLHGMLLHAALTGGGLAARGMVAALGGLFMGIGAALPSLKSNYIAGVRTPWALQDEVVWDETHRFAGRAFGLAGAVALVAALVLPPVAAFALGIGGVLLATTATLPASYVYWKRRHGG